jgi:hypothetical protein
MWRIGKDGKIADFPAGLDAIKDACLAAKNGRELGRQGEPVCG